MDVIVEGIMIELNNVDPPIKNMFDPITVRPEVRVTRVRE